MLARSGIAKQAARALLMVLFALAAACSGGAGNNSDIAPPANPAIFEITDPDNTTRGWLFGTIHALPDGVEWQTPAINEVAGKAESLMVELANLDNPSELSSIFASLATTRGLPLLAERVESKHHAQLGKLVKAARLTPAQQRRTESWAAALILARAAADANPANGVDRSLIRTFSGRPVIELEGAQAQLAIFDGLPEDAQTALLVAVIEGNDPGMADAAQLRSAWLAGDLGALEDAAQTGLMSDPRLRNALMIRRNHNWLGSIEAALKSPSRPLIAVGAAHLPGPDGLIALLQARGWNINRLS